MNSKQRRTRRRACKRTLSIVTGWCFKKAIAGEGPELLEKMQAAWMRCVNNPNPPSLIQVVNLQAALQAEAAGYGYVVR